MKYSRNLFASTAMTLSAAFDNSAGWKMDGDKIAVDGSGNPIYVDGTGREMSVEHGTIARLNNEAKGHREAKEAAEAKLVAYKDIDPVKAREALETVGKLSNKELIEAGKVDEVKREITQQYEGRLSEAQKAQDTLQQRINGMTVETAFKGSDFIRDNIAMPADFFQAAFKERFKVEDGKMVPIGSDGNPLYSKKRVGEIADFDEALSMFVENHPQKDMILKAPDARGSGNNGAGGNRGGGRIIKRSDFDAASGSDKAAYAAAMAKGEVQIVD